MQTKILICTNIDNAVVRLSSNFSSEFIRRKYREIICLYPIDPPAFAMTCDKGGVGMPNEFFNDVSLINYPCPVFSVTEVVTVARHE